jgi:hypothetical protein
LAVAQNKAIVILRATPCMICYDLVSCLAVARLASHPAKKRLTAKTDSSKNKSKQ